ncbi:MAG: hypothetical protein HW416_2088, partial [Chloroflexi bacterium]|nr:hypothetical protein [Chloroflexota bacterium]
APGKACSYWTSMFGCGKGPLKDSATASAWKATCAMLAT